MRAFYDKEKQAYLTRAFHIIDDYDLWDVADDRASDSDRLPLKSLITWNRHVFHSLKAGYVKRLDTQRDFRLSTPVARQLFRYLDKKFYRQRGFQIDIFKLCHEHLGVSRACRYVSKLEERLTPALDELVRDGYLESYRIRAIHVAPRKLDRPLSQSCKAGQLRRCLASDLFPPTVAPAVGDRTPRFRK